MAGRGTSTSAANFFRDNGLPSPSQSETRPTAKPFTFPGAPAPRPGDSVFALQAELEELQQQLNTEEDLLEQTQSELDQLLDSRDAHIAQATEIKFRERVLLPELAKQEELLDEVLIQLNQQRAQHETMMKFFSAVKQGSDHEASSQKSISYLERRLEEFERRFEQAALHWQKGNTSSNKTAEKPIPGSQIGPATSECEKITGLLNSKDSRRSDSPSKNNIQSPVSTLPKSGPHIYRPTANKPLNLPSISEELDANHQQKKHDRSNQIPSSPRLSHPNLSTQKLVATGKENNNSGLIPKCSQTAEQNLTFRENSSGKRTISAKDHRLASVHTPKFQENCRKKGYLEEKDVPLWSQPIELRMALGDAHVFKTDQELDSKNQELKDLSLDNSSLIFATKNQPSSHSH